MRARLTLMAAAAWSVIGVGAVTGVTPPPTPAAAQQQYGSDRRQEATTLVTANVPTGTYEVFGGTYIWSQACSAYGTITLQAQGPDGQWRTVVSVTAADAAGGTAVSLGSYTTVRSTVSGTTGCASRLQRVPQ